MSAIQLTKAEEKLILSMRNKKARIKKNHGRYQRTRGHSFERECAEKLRAVYPECKRHLENQAQEALGYDLDNTGAFRFQCKRNKKYAPLSCIEEVKDLNGTMPALITQGDHKKAIVAMYFDDFLKILSDIGEAF
jgi:lipopolysaccharide biosynthesis protein